LDSLGFLGGLHDQSLVDVGNDTSASDGGLDEGVQLLISADSQLQVSGGDSLNLKVLGSVACELEDLSGEVLKDGSAVHCGGSSNSAVGADSRLEESMDSSNGELHKS
jgi:hypothetical protein